MTIEHSASQAVGDDLTKVQALIDALKAASAALGTVSPEDAPEKFATSALAL